MRARTLLVPLLFASQIGATDCGSVIRDPGFDLWCGDSLCTWKVVRGDVRRAPTWHDRDAGVELLGLDSAIQQTAPVNSNDGNCIRFSLISDIEESAEVHLDIDLQGDGSVELHERIPTTHWEPSSYLIFIAPPYDGIRFELTKRGAGKAVLAQIAADISDECTGLTPIVAGPRPNGSSCTMNGECGSGSCGAHFDAPPASLFGQACGECQPGVAGPCGTGEVCGLAEATQPFLAVPYACIPERSRELGEKCISGVECASGLCSKLDVDGTGMGVCSACTTDNQCAGTTCAPSWQIDLLHQPGPSVCGPGEHRGASGAPCGTDADCASNRCNGAERRECGDGRPCQSPADCPAPGTLEPGDCTTVGVQGGSCQ